MRLASSLRQYPCIYNTFHGHTYFQHDRYSLVNQQKVHTTRFPFNFFLAGKVTTGRRTLPTNRSTHGHACMGFRRHSCARTGTTTLSLASTGDRHVDLISVVGEVTTFHGELRLLVSSDSVAGFRTLPSAEAASSSGCCASSPSPSPPSGESACTTKCNHGMTKDFSGCVHGYIYTEQRFDAWSLCLLLLLQLSCAGAQGYQLKNTRTAWSE